MVAKKKARGKNEKNARHYPLSLDRLKQKSAATQQEYRYETTVRQRKGAGKGTK